MSDLINDLSSECSIKGVTDDLFLFFDPSEARSELHKIAVTAIGAGAASGWDENEMRRTITFIKLIDDILICKLLNANLGS